MGIHWHINIYITEILNIEFFGKIMMEDVCLDNLIKSLYRSLVIPAGFELFLNELVSVFNLRSGVIVMQDTQQKTANIVWGVGVDIKEATLFFNETNEQDPFLLQLKQSNPGSLINMGDKEATLIQEQEPDFFLHLNESLDIYYAVGSILTIDKYKSNLLLFHRSKTQGEFNSEECLVLMRLIPHIQHAMQLYNLKIEQDSKHLLSYILFNQIQTPFMVLEQSNQVAFINQSAQDFLALDSSLKIINQTLHSLDDRVEKKIYESIQQCFLTKEAQFIHSPTNTLTFVPLIQEKGNLKSGVALFINQQQKLILNSQSLQEVFNLTSKEALICIELASGSSPAEIAEVCFLSYETVRTYLKHIMRKTDTSRQNELVAKLLASPAASSIVVTV